MKFSNLAILSVILFKCTTAFAQQPEWSGKATFSGGTRSVAAGFSANGKGYVGLGSNGVSVLKDFWEWVPKKLR